MSMEVTAKDVDDVTFQHAIGFVRWSNKRWGTNLRLSDYSEAWHDIWQIDLEETEQRKKLFLPTKSSVLLSR